MESSSPIRNLYEALTSALLDAAVGIRIAHLAGNGQFSLYGAELAPAKKVGAHYHEHGEELYQLVEGKGVLYTGTPDKIGNVVWKPPFECKRGDCFSIEEGQVHQLHNTSDENLIVIFGCPQSHLTTDRIVVKSYIEE